MNKALTITVALLLVLSGMHLTFSAHYCGGELHSSSVNFNGTLSSCAMESASHPVHETTFSSHCCDNETAVYTVDNNYAPSDFQLNHSFMNQVILVLKWNHLIEKTSGIQLFAFKDPPGPFSANEPIPTEICVFRI